MLNIRQDNFYSEINVITGIAKYVKKDLQVERYIESAKKVVRENQIYGSHVQFTLNGVELSFKKLDEEDLVEVITMDSEEQVMNYVNTLDVKQEFQKHHNRIISVKVFITDEYLYLGCIGHHSISDGRAMYILINEIGENYDNNDYYRQNGIKKFSNVEIIEKQQQYLQSKRFKRDWDYWEKKMEIVEELPFHLFLEDSNRYVRYLPSSLLKKLTGLTEKKKIDFLSLLLLTTATIEPTLHEEKREHTTLGFVTDTRKREEHNTMNMFVNNISLMFKDLMKKSISDSLATVGNEVISSLRHSRFPVAKHFEGKYDMLISYHKTPAMTHNLPPLNEYWKGPEQINVPMVITYKHRENELYIECDYQISKFSEEFIERFFEGFEFVLNELIECFESDQEEKLLMDIPLVNQESLLGSINKQTNDIPVYTNSLQEAIYENLTSLNKKALVLEGQFMTYEELNSESEKIANYLKTQESAKVAIWGNKNFNYIIGIVGAIKAGVPYIPLSPKIPSNHIDFIQKEHSPLLLLNANDEEKDGFQQIHNILQQSTAQKVTEWDRNNKEVCIIYTSGTTGTPKGIPIKNSSIDHVIRKQTELRIEENDHLLLIADVTFDISLFSIYGSLANGATMVLVDGDRLFEEGYVKTAIQKHPGSITCITPALIKALPLHTWDHMKFLACGGEKLDISLARELLNVKGTRIFNAYGPTEATILCTLFELNDRLDHLQQAPIGAPIDSMKMLIVDRYGRVLSDYFSGELVINGAGVLDHYYSSNQDPFITIGDEKYYRTGDLCQWTDDGIYFLNRLDNQVKINGYRIELEAIGSHLQTILEDTDFVIDVYKNSIYVYVTKPVEKAQMNRQLQEVLPEYMIPKVYITVPSIPLTKNHKVDFKKLRNRLESINGIDLSLTDKLAVIVRYMSQVLNIEKMDTEDSFFSYGGNSLKAMELAARINEDYDSNLTSIDILKYKNPQGIAEHISLAEKKELSSIDHLRLRSSETPLSSMQEMMVLDYLMNPTSTKYVMCKVFQGASIKETKKFIQSFEKAIERHDIFKIKVKDHNGQFVQSVNEQFQVQKKMQSLVSIPNWSEYVQPFDLFEDSLVRLTLFNLQQSYYIMVEMHHICADATTIIQLLNDVKRIFEGKELKPVDTDFSYYIHREREQLESNVVQNKKVQMVEKFSDVKKLHFPTLSTTNETNVIQYTFNQHTYQSIKKLQETLDVSLQTVIMSALGFLGYKINGEEEFSIGMPVNLRDQMTLLKVLGPIINTVPCKISIHPELTIAKYVNDVHDEVMMALEHKEIPLSLISKELPKQGPLFDIVAVVQEHVDTEMIEGITEIDTPVREEKFAMTYQFTEKEKEQEITLDISFNKYHVQEIHRLIKVFEETISLFHEYLSEKVSHLFFTRDLSVVEKEKVEIQSTVWDHVLQSAENKPDQLALFRSGRTYQQFVQEVNLLTAGLKGIGISSGDRVAVDYERTDEGVMLQVAISRLGAAYIPLNSEQSTVQLEEIIKSTNVRYIISEHQTFPFSGVITRSYVELMENEVAVDNDYNEATPSDLLYIMFSSGTTGKPKGIKITHTNVIAFINHGHFYHWNPGDRVAQISNNGFDGSTFDIYRALFRSGELHVLSTKEVKNPVFLYNYIAEHKIMTFFMPASYFNLLVEAFDLSEWDSITELYIGGERLSRKHIEKGLEALKGRLMNGYGPTETTVFVSTEPLTQDVLKGEIPIGKPLEHHDVYVLNEALTPIPKGFVGELYVGGPSVCAGFLNVDEDNYFVWNKEHTKKLYKTGDFVLMDEENRLYFIGRKDEQIKHNGYRINLAEIEKMIDTIASVEKSSILYVNQQLIAFVQLQEASEISQLQEEIATKFPKYMQPNQLIQVDSFEMNANGKIDKQVLKQKVQLLQNSY